MSPVERRTSDPDPTMTFLIGPSDQSVMQKNTSDRTLSLLMICSMVILLPCSPAPP